MKQLMKAHLAGYYSEIIQAGRNTYAQSIYTIEMQEYYQGRICLMGDAGTVAAHIPAAVSITVRIMLSTWQMPWPSPAQMIRH
jgi:hypothetical protein